MDCFFNPRGIAVIGASDNQHKGGYHLFRNIIQSYRGPVYPVNPRLGEIMGRECYPDVRSIPHDFDLAVFFVPAGNLPRVIEDCAAKGVRGIIIESAGFAEVGQEGRNLQETSVALARRHGIRLWGPNCMGLLDAHRGHVFSFMYTDAWKRLMRPGDVSMIVQSGMLSAGFLMMILERGLLDISKMCSIGNKCDIHETELLAHLVDDPTTAVIGMYVESIVEPRRFMELVAGTNKPVVVLKGGRSPKGARAAMSHTASLASNHAIVRAALRQANAVEVTDVNELMDVLRGFSKSGRCRFSDGTGAAVITFSGGGGIVTIDLLEEAGVPLAELGSQTLAALGEVYPPWMSPSNPADIWPAIEHSGPRKVYETALKAVMEDPAVDSLVMHLFTSMIDGSMFAELARLKEELGKPVVAWLAGVGDTFRTLRSELEDLGIPTFDEMQRCVSVLAAIRRHARDSTHKQPRTGRQG
ncbi:MAG TPA: CoA-binding protein [Deltaproteobacteria bacterium]|nr:CoA-binding protein [Deltaproteobacteria bacterium]